MYYGEKSKNSSCRIYIQQKNNTIKIAIQEVLLNSSSIEMMLLLVKPTLGTETEKNRTKGLPDLLGVMDSHIYTLIGKGVNERLVGSIPT